MRGASRYNPIKGTTVLEVVGGIYAIGVMYNKFLRTPSHYNWGDSLTWPVLLFTGNKG